MSVWQTFFLSKTITHTHSHCQSLSPHPHTNADCVHLHTHTHTYTHTLFSHAQTHTHSVSFPQTQCREICAKGLSSNDVSSDIFIQYLAGNKFIFIPSFYIILYYGKFILSWRILKSRKHFFRNYQ
jgi:hypothetical protein